MAGVRIEHVTTRAEARTTATTRPRVLCLEWLDPLYQGGHWVPEMVALAGGDAVLATAGAKSVRIDWEQVLAADPEIIILMPCGFHLDETIAQFRALTLPPAWQQLSAVRRSQVYAVAGGDYFSRPGPRLVDGLEILDAILQGNSFDHLPPHSVAKL